MKATLTEAAFTRQVLDYAKLHGWHRAHFRPARTTKGWRTAVSGDGKGFPDLILLRDDRLVVAELKVGRNDLTDEQDYWLMRFEAVGAETYVWRPNDWTIIEHVLGRPS